MRKFAAFISYRHTELDSLAASRLQKLIEHFRIPAELRSAPENSRLGYVFRDQSELSASSDLSADIRDALDNSEFLIVVCTPETPRSVWVEREIRYFLEKHDRKNVLAVLADGTPETAFPAALVNVYDDEGRVVGTAEPLAANITAPTAKRMLAKLESEVLRIIAALVGCPYDALYQRERRYKRRRNFALASIISVTAAAFMIMLMVNNARITIQNEELIEQKRSIQLSESQLLTDEAGEALADGDHISAISYALKALPADENDDRPYYAPAEAVLMEALGVFETDTDNTVYAARLQLEMGTPIVDFGSAQNGSIIAMDEFGNLAAFDPGDGRMLWYAENEYLNEVTSYYDNTYLHMQLNPVDNTILRIFGHYVDCVSASDGTSVWHYETQEAGNSQLILSDDCSMVAFYEKANGEFDAAAGTFLYDYEIVVLDSGTGTEQQRVTIADDRKRVDIQFGLALSSRDDRKCWTFIDNDTRILGYYFEGSEFVIYYIIDIAEGTCNKVYTDAYDPAAPVYHIEYCKNNTAIIVKCSAGENYAAECFALSIDTGTVLWKNQLELDEIYSNFGRYFRFNIVVDDNAYCIGLDQHLYIINVQTGEVWARTDMQATITDISVTVPNVFGIVLADGYHTIFWGNQNNIVTSGVFGYELDVGANSDARIIQGGIVFPMVENDRIAQTVYRPIAENGCCVLSVPAEGANSINVYYVKKSTDNKNIIIGDKATISNPAQTYGEMVHITEDSVYVYTLEYSESFETLDTIYRIDKKTYEITDILNCETDFAESMIIPDGSGVLGFNWSYGALGIYSFETEENVSFAESEIVELMRVRTEGMDSDLVYTGEKTHADAIYFDNGNHLLAVYSDGSVIRRWIDGNEQPLLDIPDDIIYQSNDNSRFYRLLMCTPNGNIVISDLADSNSGCFEGFAYYDTDEQKWYRAADAALGNDERVFAAGSCRRILGVMDADSMFRIYDFDKGELISAHEVNVPFIYVKQAEFILDDQYILLRMHDGQIMIIDAESGEKVFIDSLESAYGDGIIAVSDSSGRRVILMDTYDSIAIVIDCETWTLLAKLDDVCGYDPEKDEMYFYTFSDGLIVRRIPDREELIRLGAELTGN